MDLVQQFFQFCRQVEGDFCGFYLVDDGPKWLATLLPPRAVPFFEVLGREGSGSLLCTWKHPEAVPKEGQPVVWLDSEGTPNGVFAADARAFLSLLPYGTGAIYDILAAWHDYRDDPGTGSSPTDRFDRQQLDGYVQMCREQYPFYEHFVTWLQDALAIEPDPDPAASIGRAVERFPRLDEWLAGFEE